MPILVQYQVNSTHLTLRIDSHMLIMTVNIHGDSQPCKLTAIRSRNTQRKTYSQYLLFEKGAGIENFAQDGTLSVFFKSRIPSNFLT